MTVEANYHYECKTDGCSGEHDSPVLLIDVWCNRCTRVVKGQNVQTAMRLVESEGRACPTCKKEKPAADFYKGKKDCKVCYKKKYPR